MKDIVLLGDSILARTYQDESKAVIPRLHDCFPKSKIISCAAGGASSLQTISQLSSVPLSQNKVFIVSIGMNDAAPWKQVKLNDFVSNYLDILAILSGFPTVLITPYPVDVHKQAPPGRDNSILEAYSRKIMQLAYEHRIIGLDLYHVIQKAAKNNDLYVSDGVHLNNYGYDILFNTLKPVLIDLKISS